MKLDDNKNIQILHRYVAVCIAPYRTLLLAFSGGLDSTVLLDILVMLRNNRSFLNKNGTSTLRVIHIHHSLNHHADQWTAHCTQECRRYNVAFEVIKVVVNNTRREGIESAARNARYRALKAALRKNEILVTAHHQNDQAETLILALKRGSGPAGLSAMKADVQYLDHRLLRPLLNFSREELKAYANARKLHWIEDDSNTDLQFDRNFLRLKILPILQKRWPKFTKTVARSAQLCAEQEQLLDELLAETLEVIIAPDGSLCLRDLKMMSASKRAALLRRWLNSLGLKMPSQSKLECLWKEVALSRQDAVAQLKIGNQFIRRFRDRLYIVPCLQQLVNKEALFLWPQEMEYLSLPANLGTLYKSLIDTNNITIQTKSFVQASRGRFSLNGKKHSNLSIDTLKTDHDTINIHNNTNRSINIGFINKIVTSIAIVRIPTLREQISVRFGSVEGLLHIVGRSRGRKLKKIWQELNIPPWQRNRIPLLFYDDQLITALGVFVTLEGSVLHENHTKKQLFWLLDSDSMNIGILKNDISKSIISNLKKENDNT